MIHPFIVVCHNMADEFLPRIHSELSLLAEGKASVVVVAAEGPNSSIQVIPLCGGHPGWIGKRIEVRVLEDPPGGRIIEEGDPP